MSQAEHKGNGARWGMVIDLDRCTGCQACTVACKAENNIPSSNPEQAAKGRIISWMAVIPMSEGTYPELRTRFLPRPCMHCDHPPCIKVCPVGATFIDEEGLVGQIYARCIGCRYCTNNCPYTVKSFNWLKPAWPEEMHGMLNPCVSVRPKGVVEKCTFCHHRLQMARDDARAQDRELQPGDYTPACAEACPTRAIAFGDLNDPESDVALLSRDARAFTLLEDLGTEPKVHYLSEGEWYGWRKA
ncbi:MAG: 4Fe-4S dicluster domain-containing protein [Armatimonadetes bacterium]|nr:4Fe-4S dicluster domain-containing protein [Armatimonadota bacterium]